MLKTVADWIESKLHIITILIVLIAGVTVYAMYEHTKNVAVERDTALKAEAQQEADKLAEQAKYNAVVAAYTQQEKEANERQAFITAAQSAAKAAHGSKLDGPLAVVSVDTLNRLRARQAAIAAGQ